MIRFLVMDVDGTLTDGKIYMGLDREAIKAFNVKDGAGIVLLLPKANIIPVIITARESKILENRCKELNITELHQGSKNKLETLNAIIEKYHASLCEVAYIGDDLPDIPCMEAIKKAGGVVLSPSDAIPEIKSLSDYISGYKAGEGAVRDCINYLLQHNMQTDIKKKIQKIIKYILSEDYKDKDAGVHIFPDGTMYTIQAYNTKPESECVLETHRNHIDVQYMIEGYEMFNMYTTHCLTSLGKYNAESDVEFWNDGILSSQIVLHPGSLIVVYQGQPHKGAIQVNHSSAVKKVVCKIEMNNLNITCE